MVNQSGNEYANCHYAVRKTHGKASEYMCEHCERDACDWALIHGKNLSDINGYMPLCRSCHYKYDKASISEKKKDIGKAISAGKIGVKTVWGSKHGMSKLTEADVVEIREIYGLGGISQRELAEQFNVSEDTVYKIINRKAWVHV